MKSPHGKRSNKGGHKDVLEPNKRKEDDLKAHTRSLGGNEKVETTKVGKPKFVRVVFTPAQVSSYVDVRLYRPLRNGMVFSQLSPRRRPSPNIPPSFCLLSSLWHQPSLRRMLQHTLSHRHTPPLPLMHAF